MRIRSVHPEQWTDDKFLTCSPLARLLALALRNEADDNGIFEWNPAKIKIRLLPADNCDVVVLLEELKASVQVMPFEVNGRTYGIIRNFNRFQSPRKPNYRHPTPTQALPQGFEVRKEYRTSTAPVPHQSGREGEKEKEKDTSSTAKFADTPSPSPRGQETPPDGDPLAGCAELSAFYPRLCGLIHGAHPRASLPKAGSKAEHKGHDVLAKLARIDGYQPCDIVGALSWLFEAYSPRADFDWRDSIGAIPSLRDKCKSGQTKFDHVHKEWRKAAGRGAPDIEGAESWTPDRIAEFERELAEEQHAEGLV